ncbi:MAG: hypothetical protein ABI669_10745 [Usitatibacter sp.]
MTHAASDMQRHLEELKALRGDTLKAPDRLRDVKAWQSARLGQTYADVAAVNRYRSATRYFLEDLYGPKDFSRRDQAMIRILPVMSRILPTSAVETAALAIELEALSESLDQRLAANIRSGPIDEASYASAYRESSTREERLRQVELIGAVGRRLDALVKRPLVFRTLKLMRAPARVAGLEDLQDFLERGFAAFRDMGGADDFLALIESRETAILNAIFSSKARPFSV